MSVASTAYAPFAFRKVQGQADVRSSECVNTSGSTGCGKTPILSFRAPTLPEESVFLLAFVKKQIPRRAARLGMTKFEFFRSL
jgi:hypothetical protein